MLSSYPNYAMLPCENRERAKAWYEAKLGLTPVEENEGASSYQSADGSRFVLFTSSGRPSGSHTQLGWRVPDVEAEVRELKGKGVVFEDYDFAGFDKATSIASVGPSRAAWFKDSEGNLLGIVTLI